MYDVDGFTNITGLPLTAADQLYLLDQFVAAGKPVFQAEYNLSTDAFCPADNANDLNGVRYALNLDDSVFQPCR
jgi:hypothetical protein